jgi:hypothetical protein
MPLSKPTSPNEQQTSPIKGVKEIMRVAKKTVQDTRILNVKKEETENNPLTQNPGLELVKKSAIDQGLGFLTNQRNSRSTFEWLLKKREEFNSPIITAVAPNPTALNEYRDYPRGDSKDCCAFTVSTLLGLKETLPEKIKLGRVRELAGGLIEGNLKLTNGQDPGIGFGFENAQKNDLLFFRDKHSKKLTHVALVLKENIEIDGIQFIVIIHDQNDLQVELIPKDPKDNKSALETWRTLKTKNGRKQYKTSNEKLAALYKERGKKFEDTIRIRPNAKWYGDSTKDPKNNNIAFWIRPLNQISQKTTETAQK